MMRVKNMTGDLYRRYWLPVTLRDIVVVSCCLLYEHYSLRAFWRVVKSWSGLLEKRRMIMSKRRVTDEYMAGWFHYEPVSRPAPRKKAAENAAVLAARANG
jgi:hypothetical protein